MKSTFWTWRMKAGLFGLGMILGSVALSPVLWPYVPTQMDLSLTLQGPSLAHPFGLDEDGRDLLALVLYGGFVSLGICLSVVLITLIVGAAIGVVSGWLGGAWEHVFMSLTDVAFSFPRFLLALALMAMWGASVFNLIVAMSLTGWAGFARLIRASVTHLKQEEYVLSALSYGASVPWIFFKHVGPNLLGILCVQVMLSLVAVCISEAGLSFLGLGVPPDVPSWGRLLSSGRHVLEEAPHLSLFPGFALFALILSFQLCGEALRDFHTPLTKE